MCVGTLYAGGAGGGTLCATLFAGGIGGAGGDGGDAMRVGTPYAGGAGGVDGGDAMCAVTLYAGGAGDGTLCATLFAGGISYEFLAFNSQIVSVGNQESAASSEMAAAASGFKPPPSSIRLPIHRLPTLRAAVSCGEQPTSPRHPSMADVNFKANLPWKGREF